MDLCNYLHRNLGIDLELVTHNANFEPSFLSSISFPVFPVLRGVSESHLANVGLRFAFMPTNINTITKIAKSSKVSRKGIFVNASLDTVAESYLAMKGQIRAGYNVFPSGYSPLFRTMDRLVAKHMIGGILAHTEFQKKFYQKMGIGEERISIIPHCVDSNRIETMASGDICSRTNNKPRIFYAGRLQASKGILELLSSFHVISREIPSTLVIVGDGPMKEWVSEKRKALEREDNGSKIVFLDGWRPPQEFMPHMAQADVVVLPSHSEMCPIILLEAMALGKAIVATDVGGIPEVIRHLSSGVLVEQRDEKQLGQVLSELIVDSRLRRRLGLRALQTVREEYDVSVVAPKFLGFMERDI